MRRSMMILLSALVLAAPGCISSENGLCSPDETDAVFNPELLGEWEPFDPKPQRGIEGYFKVEREDPKSKAFRVTAITSPQDPKQPVPPLVVKVYLVKLGNILFLDARPIPKVDEKDEGPAHFFSKLEIKKDELIVYPLNQEFLTDHPDALRQSVPTSGLIRTPKVVATTQELRDFVVKHANDDAVWKKPGMKLRRRP